jgi:ABC-type Fe3+ transport system substrate-binding protein
LIRAAVLLLALAGAQPAAAQSFAQLAADGGPSRHERLAAAAKTEGALTLYTSNAAQTIKGLAADFERRYGVRVDVWRASSAKVLQRLLAEKTANRWDFDAASASSPELEALYREGLLQEVSSRRLAEMIEGTVPAHRGWAPQFLNVFVQGYNTTAVKKDELPKRWDDLLDPRWQGRLGVEAKAGEWYCALAKAPGGERAAAALRQVGERNGWSVRSGNSLLANMVVSGEVPLALAVYSHMIDDAKQRGAPVDWFAIAPMIGRSNGVGVSRRPKHPNAALLFYEYSLDEGQEILAKLNYVSPLKRVPSRFRDAGIVFVDPAASPADVERCDSAYEDLIRAKR